MSDSSVAEPTCVPQYEIRVHGHLGSRWVTWFDGLTLAAEDDGVTLISGPVVDQAALHGLLAKLRDLGIPLVSLVQLRAVEASGTPDLSNNPYPTNTAGATS